MLLLENVCISRGRNQILSGIDCQIAAGQIIGLVGPNGTGKSTIINAIATLLPYSGQISWHGKPVNLKEIGYLPQQSNVRADLTVIETVLLGCHEQLGWRVKQDEINRAIQILDKFGVSVLHRRRMRTLSGGQQQLVLLAQRMLRQPKLLLLDEATSALDIRHQMQVFERLRDYVRDTGALVIIAIHDLNLAARHADNVVLINTGHIAGIGSFQSVVNEKTLRNVYGIEAEILTSKSGHRVILPLHATYAGNT